MDLGSQLQCLRHLSAHVTDPEYLWSHHHDPEKALNKMAHYFQLKFGKRGPPPPLPTPSRACIL